MRGILLLLVMLNTSIFSANAQFALLQMNIKDCGKFVVSIENYINTSKLNTPIFTIFPDYDANGRTKIRASLGAFANVCPPIFDDALYEQTTKVGQQGIYYFSKEGAIVFNENVLNLNEITFKVLDSIYVNDFHFKPQVASINYMLNADVCQHDLQLDILKKVGQSGWGNYFELTPEFVRQIVDSINVADSNFLALDRLYAKWHNSDFYESLAPKFFIAYGVNDAEYFTIGITRQMYYGDDTTDMLKKIIANDDNLVYNNQLLLLKFQNKKFQKVIFIESYRDLEQDIWSCSIAFKPINDTTFLSLVGNTDISPDHQNLISTFKLRGHYLTFEKQLPIPFPKDYVEQKLDYDELSFFAISYPYFFPTYSQFMIDFSSNQYNLIENMYGGLVLLDKSSGSRRIIKNIALMKGSKDNHVYLISRMGANKHSGFTIDVNTKKVVHQFDMQESKLPTIAKDGLVILEDKARKRFFLEDPESKVRAYPLVFLEQMQ